MNTCFDVANYMLKQSAFDGEPVTHQKLQKLVYYAQSYSLAINGVPLFEDPIEARRQGPVVPALFEKYATFGDQPLPEDPTFDTSVFSEETLDLLTLVYTTLRVYSGWGLRTMVKREHPWLDATHNGTCFENTPISHKALQNFYQHHVKKA